MTSHPMTLPFQGAKSPQLDKTSNWKEVLTLNPTSGGYRTAVAYSGAAFDFERLPRHPVREWAL